MKHKYSFLLTITLICSLFFGFFYLLYNFDNKYTQTMPSYSDGIVDLSYNNFDKNPVIQLAYNWDVYPGKHLSPEEVKLETAPKNIFLGQYSGLDFGNADNSYFGKATYHLKIALPKSVDSYTLEIPEIFSAYELYINGSLLSKCGNISDNNYKSATKNSTISFFAKDGIDIVLLVSNYDHLYGGLIYPPAFGRQDNVSKLMTTRIIYRSMMLFISLTLGTMFFFAGMKTNKLYLAYTLLSLLFIGYTAYPITHTLHKFNLWIYKLEVLCYYGFITVIIYIQIRICTSKSKPYTIDKNIFTINNFNLLFERYMKYFLYVFSFIVLASTLIPGKIIGQNNTVIHIYSELRTIYKYSVFLYLIIGTIIASFRQIKYSKLLLLGFCIVATSFLADRLFPLFEPIRFGWFYEHSGFILLCIIGYILTSTFAEFYVKNQRLSIQLDIQKNYYTTVQDNIYNTRKLRHNINNHILVMKSFLKEHDTEKLWNYLETYTSELPQFKSIIFCENAALNVLISYYYNIALDKKIDINIEQFNIPKDLSKLEPDLCVLLGNLFTNAIEACEHIHNKQKVININVHTRGNAISIVFKNNFENDPVIIDNTFLSSKRIKQEGIGIPTIKNIVKKYNGQYKFNINKENNMFEVFLLVLK